MTMTCMEYKPHASGALQGFANLSVPKMGIELFGCGVFSKNGKRNAALKAVDDWCAANAHTEQPAQPMAPQQDSLPF